MNTEFPTASPPDATLPNVAITMGDPAGIGPEIILKSLSDLAVFEACLPIVLCDLNFLQTIADGLGLSAVVRSLRETNSIIDLKNVRAGVKQGVESADTGRASAEYIEESVELWRAGRVDAVATAPISKKALSMAGYDHPGHTEFYAQLTDTSEFAMSFFAEQLRVVLLSTHIPLRTAIELVTTEGLVKLIRFADRELSGLLGRKTKIAVAGLNPHASEGGMFGAEESEEISPAVKRCRDRYNIDVSGPYSADTIFLRGFRGEFDAVVSCYHDQATIAVKSLSFGSSVNVTLGLPLIRTSVDHGTAFDIAGKGIAEESSMTAAIKLAADLARPRVNRA